MKNLNNGYLRKKSTWLDFHQAEAGPLRLASEDIGIADNSSLDYEDDLQKNHHKKCCIHFNDRDRSVNPNRVF